MSSGVTDWRIYVFRSVSFSVRRLIDVSFSGRRFHLRVEPIFVRLSGPHREDFAS